MPMSKDIIKDREYEDYKRELLNFFIDNMGNDRVLFLILELWQDNPPNWAIEKLEKYIRLRKEFFEREG